MGVLQLRHFDRKAFRHKISDLIRALQAGDSSASEKIAVLMLPYMKIVGMKICKDAHELESNANFVLARALYNIGNLDPDKNPVTYITNSMRNFCIDQYRKTRVAKRRGPYPRTQEDYIVPGLEPTMDFLIEDLSLEEEDRVIISKIILDKTPIRDLPKKLSLSPKEIRNRLNKIKSLVLK